MDEPYKPGMFQSDGSLFDSLINFHLCNFFLFEEPGYYEKGAFGIRLETDLEVVATNVTL